MYTWDALGGAADAPADDAGYAGAQDAALLAHQGPAAVPLHTGG